MWLNLFRAEFSKILWNRFSTGLLVLIWPFMALLFVVLGPLSIALLEAAQEGIRENPPLWTETALGVWNIPVSIFGRLMLIGFTGVLFGGEYGWNTWKTIVPRNQRIPLLLTKFVALALFVMLAYFVMTIFWTMGWGLSVWVADANYGPTITGEVINTFVGDYLLKAGLTFFAVVIAAGFAALAAMITRSILGSIVGGFIISVAETSSLLGFAFMAFVTGYEHVVQMVRFTPTYAIMNVTNWVEAEQSTNWEVGDQIISSSMETSILVLVVWVLVLIGLTLLAFRCQDLS